jgi:hypothetical protein
MPISTAAYSDPSNTVRWGPKREVVQPKVRAAVRPGLFSDDSKAKSLRRSEEMPAYDWGDLGLKRDEVESAVRQTQAELLTIEPADTLPSEPALLPTATPLMAQQPGERPSPSFEESFAQGPQGLDVNCDQERQKLKPIKAITNQIAAEPGDFPPECGLADVAYKPRDFCQLTYTWKASNLCHKPLYFEQPRLERYGHSLPPLIQPAVCAAHFFGSVVLLPYKMGIDLPTECVYSLGYYRPGSCAPFQIPGFPLSPRGAAFEAGAMLGIVYGVP